MRDYQGGRTKSHFWPYTAIQPDAYSIRARLPLIGREYRKREAQLFHDHRLIQQPCHQRNLSGEHLNTWRTHSTLETLKCRKTHPLSWVPQRLCGPNWPSSDRTRYPFWPLIALQPAMHLTGPGLQPLEVAHWRGRVLTSARQKTRATKPCQNTGSERARDLKPSLAHLFHVIIY